MANCLLNNQMVAMKKTGSQLMALVFAIREIR